MESSKEKIEAQLCAYVDGELDDAQRADIEQHLSANPQHQALIAELRAASGLLRDLPRVAAPIELNESLCGQLERSSLLDAVDDPSDPHRSGNRWPQFTAVAAVLILAVGLGLVIYFVLPPSGGRSGNQLAMENHAKEAGLTASTRDQDGDSRLEEKAKSTTNRAAGSDFDRLAKQSESELQSRAAGKPSDAPRPDQAKAKDSYAYNDQAGRSLNRDLDVARQPEARRRGMVTAAEVENVRKWMNESLGTDTNFFNSTGNTSLYLVVSTQNTSAVNGQLAAYFKGNGIQYMADDSRPTADFVAGAGEKLSAGDKFNGGGFGGGGGSAGGRGGASASSLGGGRMAVRAATPELKASEPAASATPAPAAKPDFSTADARRALQDAPSASLSDSIKKEAAPPAPQEPGNELARGDGASKNLQKLDQQVRLRHAVEEKDKAAAGAPFDLRENGAPTAGAKLGDDKSAHNVIVARMNRRQLNELSAELSREQGQHAELKEFAPSAIDGLSDSSKVKSVIASLGAPAATGLNLDPSALTLGKAVASPPATAPTTVAPSGAAADRAGVESFGATLPPASRPTDRAYGRGTAAGALSPTPPSAAAGPATGAAKSEGIDGSDVKDPSGKRLADNRAAAGTDALHLKIDPMDEPVDVVIVVKSDGTSADTTAADAEKPTAKPAPAGATDAANPTGGNK